MIAELKRKNVRTVHSQKVVRLTLDVPFSAMMDRDLDEEDLLNYLDQRVGRWVGIRINVLDAEEQEVSRRLVKGRCLKSYSEYERVLAVRTFGMHVWP